MLLPSVRVMRPKPQSAFTCTMSVPPNFRGRKCDRLRIKRRCASVSDAARDERSGIVVLQHGVGAVDRGLGRPIISARSEEHTSELQSLMRISYAVFCLKKNKEY